MIRGRDLWGSPVKFVRHWPVRASLGLSPFRPGWGRLGLASRCWYLLCLVMALIAFGAMATSLPVVWNTPYDGGYTADRAGWVVAVDRSGAAYAAGIRIGDRLTAVDGVPLRDVRGLYREKGPGDTVRLSLERSGHTRVVAVPLSATPLSFRLLPLELLFVAAVFWALGLAAWFLLPFDPTTRRFYLISQLVAFAFGVDFLARLRSPWLLALTDILLLLLAPMVLQFHSLFPEPMRSRFGRFLVGVAYALSLVLIVGVLVDWAMSDGIGAYRPLGDARDAHVLLTLGASIGVLVYRLWRLRSRSEPARRTGLVMAAGMAFGWLPLILFSALPHLFLGEPWVVTRARSRSWRFGRSRSRTHLLGAISGG